jgi:K+-sensing histidine kinase KdpD
LQNFNNSIPTTRAKKTVFCAFFRLNIYSGQSAEKTKEDVIIEIVDTGKGIPGDILPKIFEPFFTTKEPGKGTGLGLTIVHLILERHKGTITVESSVDKGTKFTIRLPFSLPVDLLSKREARDDGKKEDTLN